MKTIILKWNPAFSSYTMFRYLKALHSAVESSDDDLTSNWSIRDYDKVSEGDRFYMLKVGYGQTGIVMRGKVTSNPYESENWGWRDNPIYYVDYLPEIMLNPDGVKLLTSAELTERIPDFDWYGGPSGLVLSDENATLLEEMWEEYMAASEQQFEKESDDNLYIAMPDNEEDETYKISTYRNYRDSLTVKIVAEEPYYDDLLRKTIEIENGDRLMKKLKAKSIRALLARLRELFPTAEDLSKLCSDLFKYGIEFDNDVVLVKKDDNDEDDFDENDD